MSFISTMMMIEAIAAIIIVTISSFMFVAILGGHLDRGVHTERIDFVLAKENVIDVFTEEGVTNLEVWDSFEDPSNSKFGIKVELGKNIFISNRRIYDYADLCKIEDTFVKCSKEFKDFYLVDDKLEVSKINVVMQTE